jgi:hypothetical protein
MNFREQYVNETKCKIDFCNESLMKYIEWLEGYKKEPQILLWIKKMFEHAENKQWYEVYFSFDIHGTISVPDYRKGIKKDPSEISKVIYYPYAKETLQLLTETRPDIIKILWTSSYPEELKVYRKTFEKDGIIFKYNNENPEIADAKGSFGFYERKFYFNVLWEDKSGFDPETDWKPIYEYFKKTDYRPNPKWSMKYKEDYHKS